MHTVTGSQYWFDDGVRAESKEIYDVSEDAWCWIETDGTKAVDKDVFIPYNVAADNTEAGGTVDNGGTDFGAVGKWVRYDAYGHMVKGWIWGGSNNAQRWYFDLITGAMAKGQTYIDGNWYYFNEVTGVLEG